MKNRFLKGLRSPITWILLAIMIFWGYSQISNAGKSFKEVETQTIIGAITGKQVDSALLLANDQQIRVVLKSGVKISDSSRLQASYLANQESELVRILSTNPPPKKWDVKVARQSILVSLLLTLIPFILIAFIFFYLISRAQGGGRRGQAGRGPGRRAVSRAPGEGRAHVPHRARPDEELAAGRAQYRPRRGLLLLEEVDP